jgi:hypothetical protein
MIPRRRNNEETDNGSLDGGSNHHPLAPPNGTTHALNVETTTTTNHNTNNNTNTNNAPHRTSRSKRNFLLMGIVLACFAWISQKERNVLDESRYEDARKHYLKKNDHQMYSTIDHYKRSTTQPSGKFVLQPESEFSPGIAWLMSFPNSGTSFTMTMVARSTNKSFATNYGNEVIAPDEPDSFSIYPRRPEGPYWPGMSGKQHTPRDLPDNYVITKTHCGSRCSKCGPDEYIETTETFLERCASGHGEYTPGSKRRTYDVTYPPERVQKAIHLYRNPMHNLIARYHLEHRHKGYKNDTEWQDSHSNDADGLHKWCEWTKTTYREEDIAFFGSKRKIPKAPCYGEFYKWTQWHNLAHESIELMREGGPSAGGTRRDVPLLKIFYEDYNTNFEPTVRSIIDFLELEQVAPFRSFESRKDYNGYFPPNEMVEIKKLVKSIASDATWTDVQHYFENDNDGYDDEEDDAVVAVVAPDNEKYEQDVVLAKQTDKSKSKHKKKKEN